jgi:hypothetical protein
VHVGSIFHSSSFSVSGWFIFVLNFSHCMWAAGTPVYFLKENRRGKPSVIFHSSPLLNQWLVYFALVGSRQYNTVYSCQREWKRETQMSSSFLPFK